MPSKEESKEILKELFEESLLNTLKRHEELGKDEVKAIRNAYNYLFAYAYGKNWTQDKDDLSAKVESIISSVVEGE